MDINPVILSIPVYFLLIGLELLHQLVTHKKLYRTNDAISNISCGISSQVTGALWGVLSIGMYQFVYQYLSVGQMPQTIWSNVVLFLLVDFFYYWYHRASHEINFLWNTSHVVHHQSEEYNLSVALRQASLGGVFSMLFYLPLAFIGFNAYAFVAVKGINLIYQFWIHTEAINKLPGWFEYIFNTPSHHRVHHGRNPKYIDRNHAGTLIIWDRMFGTFQQEEEKPTYGVTTRLNTWNPVRANLEPIVGMIKQVHKTNGLGNKLKVLFYKPGWFPAEQGGYKPAPEVDNTPKYDAHPDNRLIQYIFFQFVLILGFTAVFLFTSGSYEIVIKLLMAGFIMWSIAHLGLMMENRPNWIRLEFLRILVSGGVLYFYLPDFAGMVITGTHFILFGSWFYIASRAHVRAKSIT